MSQPRVSIIICTYNRDNYLHQSLKSIAEQDAPVRDYELILVNNNSTDRTDEIGRKFSSEYPYLTYKYVIEMNQGLSHARNRGIIESEGEILVYLDDDAFAEPLFISNLIRFYDSRRDVVATGGKTIPKFESAKPVWMSYFLLPLVAAVDLGTKPRPFPRNWFPIGANMAFRRSIIKDVGYFDVNLGRTGKNMQGGEEKDIFRRIRAKGHQPWYLPDTIAHHVIPDSRMMKEYIRKQSYGIGYSERIRTASLGTGALLMKYASELAKWAVTVVLSLFYLITARPGKSIMLIRFRGWVSSGLFFKKLM